MFTWLGKSSKTRKILNELYGTIEKSQLQRAKNEISRYQFLVDLEKRNSTTTKV